MSIFWLGTALIIAATAVALAWPALRGGHGQGRLALLAAAVATPLGGVALYAQAGHPGMTDAPLASRGAEQEAARQVAAYKAMLDKLATELAAAPANTEGWVTLAEGYGRLGAFGEAGAAFAQAHSLRSDDAALALSHAEMLMRAANDRITPDADAMLDAALEIDPTHHKARLLKGLAHAQAGRPADAKALWRPLLDDLPAASPWRPALEENLARLDAMPEGQ
jgi:cytochrome c-type biogenesis protein CcmH